MTNLSMDFMFSPVMDVGSLNVILSQLKSSLGKLGDDIQLIDESKLKSQLKVTQAEFKKTFEEAQKGADGLGKSVDDVGEKSKKTGSLLSKMFAFNQMRDAVGAVTGALQQIVDVGVEYESSLAAVGAITGFTGDNLNVLGDAARGLAKEFGGTATSQLSSFQGILSKLGPDIAKDSEALALFGKNVNTLSAASGDDAATSMNAITDAMLQMGLATGTPIEQARKSTEVINALAAGAQVGAAEIPQVADALVACGVAAKGANLGIVDVNAAIQVMAVGGKTGAEAGNALRNVLGLLQKASGPAEAAMKKMGTSSKELGNLLTSQGLDVAMKKLSDGMNTLGTDAEKNAALMEIFGTENASAAGILMQNLDQYKAFSEGIKAGMEGNGSAFDQAAQRMNTAEGMISRAKAWINDAYISISQGAGQTLTAIMGVTTQVAPMIMTFAGLKDILPTEAWGKIGGSIKTFATTMLTTLVPSFATTGAAGATAGASVQVAWLPVTATILAIVAAGYGLYSFFTKTQEGIAIFNSLKQTMVQVAGAVITGFGTIWTTISPLWDSLKWLGTFMYDTVLDSFKQVSVAVSSAFSLPSGAGGLLTFIQDIFTGISNLLKPLTAVADFIIDVFALSFKINMAIVTTAVKAVVWAVGLIYDGAKNIVTFMYNTFKPAFEIVGKYVTGILNALTDAIKWVSNAIDGLMGKDTNKTVTVKKKEAVTSNAPKVEEKITEQTNKQAADEGKKTKEKRTQYEIAKKHYELTKEENKSADAQAALDEKKAAFGKTELQLQQEKLAKQQEETAGAQKQYEAFAKVYNIAEKQYNIEKARGKVSEKTLADYSDAKKTLDGLNTAIINSKANEYDLTLKIQTDKESLAKELAKIKSDIERNQIEYNIKIGKASAADLSLFDLNELKKELEEAQKIIDKNTPGLSANVDDKAYYSAILKKAQIQVEIDEETAKLADAQEEQRIKKIANYAVQRREIAIHEAEKTYKEELKKSEGNNNAQLEAYLKLVQAKRDAEIAYSNETTSVWTKNIAEFTSMFTNAFNFDIEVKDNSSSVDSIKQSYKDQEETLKDSLKNREITYQEYLKKIADLQSSKEEEIAKATAKNSSWVLDTLNQGMANAFSAMQSTAQNSLMTTVSTYQSTQEAYTQATVDMEAKKSAMQAAIDANDLNAAYKYGEEYKKLSQDRDALNEKSTSLTSEMYANMAMSVGASLGQAVASGQNAFKAVAVSAIDALQAMIPVFVANIFGVTSSSPANIATLGIWGAAQFTLLTAGLYGLAAVAKSAVKRLWKGEVDIDGPGTTTSDSIPAMLSRGESVVNARATASPFTADFLEWNNTHAKGLPEYIKANPAIHRELISNVIEEERLNNVATKQLLFQLELENSSKDKEIRALREQNAELGKKLDTLIVLTQQGNYTKKTYNSAEVSIELDAMAVIKNIQAEKLRILRKS